MKILSKVISIISAPLSIILLVVIVGAQDVTPPFQQVSDALLNSPGQTAINVLDSASSEFPSLKERLGGTVDYLKSNSNPGTTLERRERTRSGEVSGWEGPSPVNTSGESVDSIMSKELSGQSGGKSLVPLSGFEEGVGLTIAKLLYPSTFSFLDARGQTGPLVEQYKNFARSLKCLPELDRIRAIYLYVTGTIQNYGVPSGGESMQACLEGGSGMCRHNAGLLDLGLKEACIDSSLVVSIDHIWVQVMLQDQPLRGLRFDLDPTWYEEPIPLIVRQKSPCIDCHLNQSETVKKSLKKGKNDIQTEQRVYRSIAFAFSTEAKPSVGCACPAPGSETTKDYEEEEAEESEEEKEEKESTSEEKKIPTGPSAAESYCRLSVEDTLSGDIYEVKVGCKGTVKPCNLKSDIGLDDLIDADITKKYSFVDSSHEGKEAVSYELYNKDKALCGKGIAHKKKGGSADINIISPPGNGP